MGAGSVEYWTKKFRLFFYLFVSGTVKLHSCISCHRCSLFCLRETVFLFPWGTVLSPLQPHISDGCRIRSLCSWATAVVVWPYFLGRYFYGTWPKPSQPEFFPEKFVSFPGKEHHRAVRMVSRAAVSHILHHVKCAKRWKDKSWREGAEENCVIKKSLLLVTKGLELFGFCNDFFHFAFSVSIILTPTPLPSPHPISMLFLLLSLLLFCFC